MRLLVAVLLLFTCSLAQVANDDCANAIPITPTIVDYDLENAIGGDDTCDSPAFAKSVWFKFSLTYDAVVEISAAFRAASPGASQQITLFNPGHSCNPTPSCTGGQLYNSGDLVALTAGDDYLVLIEFTFGTTPASTDEYILDINIVVQDNEIYVYCPATINEGASDLCTVELYGFDATVSPTLSFVTASSADVSVDTSNLDIFDAAAPTNFAIDSAGPENLVEGPEQATVSVTLVSSIPSTFTNPRIYTAEVIILDLDTTTVTLSSVTVTEGQAFAPTIGITTPIAFDVTVEVSYSSSDNINDFSVDLTAGITFTIPAGLLAGSLVTAITVLPDDIVEPTSILFTGTINGIPELDALGTYWSPSSTPSNNFLEDSDRAIISFLPTATIFGEDVGADFDLTSDVGLEGINISITVSYGPGAAPQTESSDFTSLSTVVQLNENVQQVLGESIPISSDSLPELAENFLCTFSISVPATISDTRFTLPSSVQLTIDNDDAVALTFTVDNSSPAEGNTIIFTVTSTSDLSESPFEFSLSTTNNAPTSNADYAAFSPALVNTASSPLPQTFSLLISEDNLVEDSTPETFDVTLNIVTQMPATLNNGGDAYNQPSDLTISITSVDTTTLTVTPAINPFVEPSTSSATVAYQLTITKNVQGGLIVSAQTEDGSTATTASAVDGDYVSLGPIDITFPETGPTTNNFEVTINSDGVAEPTEVLESSFTSSLTGNVLSTVSITDSDVATIVASVGAITVQENAGTINIEFMVTGASIQGSVTFNFIATPNTATENRDYDFSTAVPVTLVDPQPSDTFSVSVQILVDNDKTSERDFTVSVVSSLPYVDTSTAQTIVTIGTDRTVTLSIAGPLSGNAFTETVGDLPVTLTVSVSAHVAGGFTVPLILNLGTATEASDITMSPSSLDFVPNGPLSQTVTLTILDNQVVEPVESFTFEFDTPTGVGAGITVISTDTYSGTITDNDISTITISSTSGREENTVSMTFVVTSTHDVEGGWDFNYAIAGITATSGDDYSVTVAPLTFAPQVTAGPYTNTITITIEDDNLAEADETIRLQVLAPTATENVLSRINFPTATTFDEVIIDNEPAVTLTIAGAGSVQESTPSSTLDFVLTANAIVQGGINVELSISPSSLDYQAPPTTFTMTGTTYTFSLTIEDDSIVEPSEVIVVAINQATSSERTITTAGSPADGTILDNDRAAVTVSSPTVTESTGVLVFTISSTAQVQGGFTVTLTTAPGANTATSDYTVGAATTHTFSTAGETFTLSLTFPDDNIVEVDKTVTVTPVISGTSVPLASFDITSGTGTIQDSDTTSIVPSAVTVTEGGAATIIFTSSAAVQGGFSISYTTVPGTATSPSDFTASSGTLTFAPAAGSTASVMINTVDSDLVEHTEQFTVTLSQASITSIVPIADIIPVGAGQVTILDNDVTVITIDDVTTDEENAFVFSITSSEDVDNGFTVNLQILLLGTTSTADLGSNSISDNLGITFGGPATTRTFSVYVTNDDIVELDQQFLVSIVDVTGTPNSQDSFDITDTGTGTIVNTDTTDVEIICSVTSLTVNEGDPADYMISFSDPVEVPVTVHLQYSSSLTDGGYHLAVEGTDYTPVPSVTVTALLTEQTFIVDALNDNFVELPENFVPSFATDAITSAIADEFFTISTGDVPYVVIVDADSATVTINSQTAVESSGSMTFTISTTASIQPSFDLIVTASDGTPVTATEDTDFSHSGTATVTGSTSVPYSVTILSDTILETTENFDLTLSFPTDSDWVESGASASITFVSGSGTITDTSTTTITAVTPSVTGSEDPGLPIVYTFVSSPLTVDGEFSFQLQVVTSPPGTATPGTDYSLPFTTVTFNTLTSTSTFSVTIESDTIVEPTETFQLTTVPNSLSTTYTDQASRITLGSPSPLTVTGSIDDTADTSDLVLEPFIANTFSYTEGANAIFIVTLTEAVQGGFTIPVTLTRNGQTEVEDYVFTTTTLPFAGNAGESRTFSVGIFDDQILEPDTEGFTLTLGTPSAQAGDIDAVTFGSLTVTINDNDSTTITASSPSTSEGNPAVVSFTSTNEVDGGFSIDWSILPGSALGGGVDYTAPPASVVSFSGTANEVVTAAVTIATNPDGLVEGSETFTVSPGTVSVTSITRGFNTVSGSVTITSPDTATFTFTNANAPEGDAMSLTVSSSNPISGGFTLVLSYNDPVYVTAGDFSVTRPVSLSFTETQTSQSITITSAEDSEVELSEQFTVSISSITPGDNNVPPISSSATGTGTINNDDTTTLTVVGNSATEGSAVGFVVTLLNDVYLGFTLSGTASVLVQADGAESTDFSTVPVSVTFTGTVNEQQTINIGTSTDFIVELNEVFQLSLSVTSSTVNAADIIATATATGTINDDDTTILTITGTATVNEGVTTTYTVTSSLEVEGGFSVPVTITPGSAVAADYSFTPPSLSFSGAAPSETDTFTVDSAADNLIEPASETFSLNTGTVTGTTIPTNKFTAGSIAVTITDTETGSVSISSATASEVTGSGTVTFTLSKPVQDAFTASFTVTPVTATLVDDFSFGATTVSFAGGATATTDTVTFTVSNDNIVENAETFTVSFDSSSIIPTYLQSRLVAGSAGTQTITSEDTTTLTINDATATEGSPLAFGLSLTNPVDDAFVVTVVVTFSGDAVAADLGAATTTVNFAPEAQSGTFTQPTNIDNIVELAETFTVSLSISGYDITTPASSLTSTDTATGTINNDDSTAVTFNFSPLSNPEEAGPITITVELSAPVSVAITVPLSFGGTAAGTAPSNNDYTAPASVSFSAGSQSTTFSITINEDTTVEFDETIIIGSTAPTVTGILPTFFDTTATSTYTIENDDSTSLSFTAVTPVSESVGTLNFGISSTESVAFPFSVGVEISDGTAVISQDWNPTTTSVSFPAGVQAATFAVSIINDMITEPTETFTVNFGPASSITGTTATQFFAFGPVTVATGTIQDDDVIVITIGDESVSETATEIVFTLEASRAASAGYTITLSAQDVTTQGVNDYTLPSPFEVTFAAGETSKTISITIVGNTLVEPEEQFRISMTAVTSSIPTSLFTITDTALGTITNDDNAQVTVSDVTSPGEAGSMQFQFQLSAAVAGGFSVTVLVDAAPSAESNDYTLATSVLTFVGTANEIQTATVNIQTDGVVELNEQFTIRMGAVTANSVPSSSIIITDTAVGTITDDDFTTVMISSNSPATEPTAITYSFSLTHSVEGGFTLSLSATSGTAVIDTDFTFGGQTITLDTLNVGVPVTVTVLEDTIVEPNEDFTINISGPGGTSINTAKFTIPTSVPGVITDVDTVTISINDASVTEGGNLAFGISASALVASSYTLNFAATDVSTSAADYTAPTPLAVSNTQSLAYSVTVTNDILVENVETFTLSVASVTSSIATSRFIITDTGTGTITSEDTTVITLSSPPSSPFLEDVGTVQFTISTSNPVQGGVTVNIATSFPGGPTSAASNDITLVTTSVTFSATTPAETLPVLVNIINDGTLEPNEVFQITGTVAAAANVNLAAVTSPSPASATITDNDSASVTATAVSSDEENSPFTFVFQLQQAVQGGFTVTFSITPNTPTTVADYSLITTTVNFAGTQGETQNVLVGITDDSLVEPSETFTLTGTPSTTTSVNSASISVASVNGEILNTDTTSVSINSRTQNEEVATMIFTVSLTNPVQGGLSVGLTASPIAPTTGADFTLSTGGVLFPSGSTTAQTAGVAIFDDDTVEPNEQFTLSTTTITAIAGFPITVPAASGTGTIVNTDSTSITVEDVSGFEGATLTFTFTLSNPVESIFTIGLQTAPGTASASEFSLNTPTITFTGPTALSETASVTLNTDSVTEPAETFTISMTALTGSNPTIDPTKIIITDTAIGTIQDDDPTAGIIANNGPIGEGTIATVTLQFTDPNPSGTDSYTGTVNWGDGSPVTGTGVTISSTTASGLTTGTLTATGFAYADDGPYTVTVTLSDGNGGSLTATTSITVTNVSPTFTGSSSSTPREEGVLLTFTATWNDKGTADTHTFTVNFGDGSAAVTGTVTETPSTVGSTAGYSGSASATHYYADDRAYTIQYCLADDNGGNVCASTSVTILNRLPTIGPITTDAFSRSVTVLSFDVGDLGSLDGLTGTIAWGDASTSVLTISQSTFGPPGNAVGQTATVASISHTYLGFGFYTATITIRDDDGGQTSVPVSFLNNPSAVFMYVPLIVTWVPSPTASTTDTVDIYLQRNSLITSRITVLERRGTTLPPNSQISSFRPFGMTSGSAELVVRSISRNEDLVRVPVFLSFA